MRPFIYINPDNPGAFYALFYVLAFLTAFAWLMWEGRRRKFPLIPWMMVIAAAFLSFMAGSRLVAFTSEEWSYVLQLEPIPYSTSRSVLGGLLFCVPGILAVRKFLRFNQNITDAFAQAVPLAMAVQQLGCLMAGCCAGTPSDLPWAVQYGTYSDAFAHQLREGLLQSGAAMALPVHPAQVYEFIGCLVMVVLLSRLRSVFRAPGNLFLASLLLFGVMDFSLEFVRAPTGQGLDQVFLSLTIVQWILLLAAGVLFVLIRFREMHFAVTGNPGVKSGLLRPSICFALLAVSFVIVSRWMDVLEIVSIILVLFSILVILGSHLCALSASEKRQTANRAFCYVILPVLFLLPMAIGCTAMRTVTPAPSVVLPRIYPGDMVHVLMNNGEEINKMKVVTIDDSGNMIGEFSRHQTAIKAMDIRGIQKLRKPDGSKQDLYLIEPGSTIDVTLKNGSRLKHVEVITVDSVRISYRKFNRDKSQEILRSDIASIKVKMSDPGGTAGLIIGGLIFFGLVSIAVAAASAPTIVVPSGKYSCK